MTKSAKGKRPIYFENPETDKLLAMVLALAEEVSVLRDRMDTVERLAEAKGLLSSTEIETYQPNPQAASEREQRRADYIARILRVVQTDLEADLEAIAPEATIAPETGRSPS